MRMQEGQSVCQLQQIDSLHCMTWESQQEKIHPKYVPHIGV